MAVEQSVEAGALEFGFEFGEAALEQFDLRLIAAPFLTRLRDQTQQTAILSVAVNGEPIVLKIGRAHV